MLLKNLRREIQHSLGRFIAIFAIMALGSGFFAGLLVTKDTLVSMADTYLHDQSLFDYRLVSTLGLTEDDVDAFSALDSVENVQGSITEDLYLKVGTSADSVVRVHTLTPDINVPYLVSGRMPETPEECVLDASGADSSSIGMVFHVSDNNDSDILDHMQIQSFKVVGIVQSPYYLNKDRGTTALGTGTVDRFIYVQPDVFDLDYFTEVFVTLTATQDTVIYSEDYDRAAESVESRLTTLMKQQGLIRRTELVDEATAEYNDGVAEYEQEKADAQAKLNTAYNDLKQAETDIVTGQEELDNSKTELEDGQQQLEDAKLQAQEGQNELDAAKQQLAQSREELDAGWEQYHAGVAAYGEAAMAQTLAQLNQSEEEYSAGAQTITEQETTLQDAWNTIAEQEQALADGQTQYEEGLVELEQARKDVSSGWNDYYRSSAEAQQEFAEAEQELADALDEIQSIQAPTTYVLGRETNAGYTSFDYDTSIITSIAKVFPFLFFLIAALVCITTMTRMVEENRTLIGTLKALGYDKGAIAGEFLLYAGVASLAGSILGFLLGSYILPKIIWTIYAVRYELTNVTFFFNTGLFLATVVGYFLCAMAATWYVCWHELHEVPAMLMRPKAPKAGKRIFLEKLPFFWNRLSFLHKVAIRNVVQYKQRMLMMVLGIGGCTALLVTGFGLYDSIADIVSYQYGEITTYDYLVSFTDPITEEDAAQFHTDHEDLLEDTTLIRSQNMDLTFGDTTKTVQTIIPAENSLDGFIHLQYEEDAVPFPGVGEIVICKNLAEQLDLFPGDVVQVTDEDLATAMELTVSGIMENYVSNQMFIAPESFVQHTGQSPEMNAMLVNAAEEEDLYAVSAKLLDDELVSNVQVTQDTMDSIDTSLSNMVYIVYIVIVCSGALAFIVLYNLTNININERIREIATIKVLGFYPRETSSYVMRESMILTGMGALVGLLAGKLLHGYVMAQVVLDAMYFPVVVRPISYLYAVLLTFLFALIINSLMRLRLKSINMAESLKSIE